MKKVIPLSIVTLALLAGCSSSVKTNESLKTNNSLTISIPDKEACHRKYVSVKLDTFQECLSDGMTYMQVVNTLGYLGTLQAQSGNTEIWQWNDGDGKYLSATFVSGRLSSKSQIGLEDPN